MLPLPTRNITSVIGRQKKWLAPVIAAFLGLLAATAMAAPQASSDSTRQVPAPWRPAFGPINRDAANGAEGATNQATAAGNDTTSRAATAPASGQGNAPLQATDSAPAVTRVTRSLNTLPNDAGQVWREYDISPYTSKIRSIENPQQALVDWILLETGTEMWFQQPLGILNASTNQLRVYHTPEIQKAVQQIVDRFVRTRAQMQNIDVNLVTVGNPNWRARSYPILQSIDVQSQGIEAWLVSKENAALLLNGLSKRADFRQHSSGRLTNHDGQTLGLEKTKPVQFVRNLRWANNGLSQVAAQGTRFQPQMTTINEGYSLDISCLSSLDNRSIEAVIECEVDQVETLKNVRVEVPDAAGNSQQINLQIPQLVSWRLKERFRWPSDQVLVLSCGVVANPDPAAASGRAIPLLGGRSDRAEALLFIDYRGPATEATVPQTANDRLAPIRKR